MDFSSFNYTGHFRGRSEIREPKSLTASKCSPEYGGPKHTHLVNTSCMHMVASSPKLGSHYVVLAGLKLTHYIDQSGLELPETGLPLPSEIKCVHHNSWLVFFVLVSKDPKPGHISEGLFHDRS